MSSHDSELTGHNIGQLNSLEILSEHGIEIDATAAGSLGNFVKAAVKSQPGPVQYETAVEFITDVGRVEAEHPLFSGRAFLYPATSGIRELGTHCTAETTVLAAGRNMARMISNFGTTTFAARSGKRRQERAVEWTAPLDDVFQLRARGASGASAFSIDFAIGLESDAAGANYNELWRTGVDTEQQGQATGARIIRTGTAVKPHEAYKKAAFEQFRKTHGVMPQRLLGLLSLYFIRELQPDYAVALSTEGARRISTLGRSKGGCDYDGIFEDIGFGVSSDPHWLMIPDFENGFYEALDRSDINRREASTLYASVAALNAMQPIGVQAAGAKPTLFQLCSDTSSHTIGRELQVFMS